MNLAIPLERHARATPSRVAILFEGRAIGYGELDAQANRLANALRARGVAAGDRVAIFLPNVPEFVIVYYAARKLGAVPVSINPGSGPTAEQIVAHCRDGIAAYKVPARIDLVSELPKSPTGKLLKRVLREQARAGAA